MTRALALILIALAVTRAASQEIILRTAARVPPNAPVTLADVALIRGDDTGSLASIVLDVPRDTLDAADIRTALTNAGVNWGRVSLTGRSCRIFRATPAPALDTPTQVAADESLPHDAIRWTVEAQLHALLNAGPDELRLSFQPDDLAVLSQSADGATIEVRELGRSDKMPLRITTYRDGLIELDRTIRVGVSLRRNVVIPIAPIDRGTVVSPAMFRVEQRWASPDADLAGPDDIVERRSIRRIEPDQPFSLRQLEGEELVRRGDTVSVTLVKGTTTVRALGRAREAGRRGDVIAVELLGSGARARATVADRGRLVIQHDAHTETDS